MDLAIFSSPVSAEVTADTLELLALREAALALAGNLSLSETLQRIVKAAARLATAQYAALGVPDQNGTTLAEFVTTGLSAEAEARISHRPHGDGVLGLLLREPHSLRLANLHDHPRAVGFPAHHPPMTSFLGVPIIHQQRNLGNLYLTNKIGAAEFTAADQLLVELLASYAGAAIQNAHFYEASVRHAQLVDRRNQELAVLNAVTSAVNRSLDLTQVLTETLDQVLALSSAEAAEIFLFNEKTGEMAQALHRGLALAAFQETRRFRLGEGLPGWVAQTKEALVVPDLRAEPRFLRHQVIEAGFHTYVCLPLLMQDKAVGCLGLAARPPATFAAPELALLHTICQQVAVAVENARLHHQVAQLAVLEERQRIGMDLHDGVIQSIYAVGLTLELVEAQLHDGDTPAAQERVGQAMNALNQTIRDIRSYILDLRPRRLESDNLVHGLQRLLAEFKANTLIAVDFTADPQVEAALPDPARMALFHIAQEALSNAARHSRATRMTVGLLDDGAYVLLRLRDNGRGFQPAQTEKRMGHGLLNMQDRAHALGGQLSFASPPGGGTEVTVSVPKRTA